jgi:benzoyl-CoA reductase/2-hydroxyglutaryl-CoA dehydratase subunit BcrC/BadD/HgdB
MEALERGKQRPAPLSAFDQFKLMAPIVEMRGEVGTVEIYSGLLNELDERIANGVGAVLGETKRLLWDNLPIWYAL